MTRLVLRVSIPNVLLVASILAYGWLQASPVLAQHARAAGPLRVPVPHVVAPPVPHPPAARPHVLVSRPLIGLGRPVFAFGRRPFFGFPFFYEPFFGFERLGFNAEWWPTYCPFWGWGLGCTDLPFSG